MLRGSDTATSTQAGALSKPPAPATQTAGTLSQPPAAAAPHPVATSTTATMTDQRGDWSSMLVVEDEEKEKEDEVTPPLQSLSRLPKNHHKGLFQRTREPNRATLRPPVPSASHNPCVADTNDSIMDLSSEELDEPAEKTSLTGWLIELDSALTPVRSNRLKTAVQSRLDQNYRQQTSTVTTPQTQTRRPTRHLNTTRKMHD